MDFNGSKTIGEIDVYTTKDYPALLTQADPSATDTFTQFGTTAFNVQYWNGSSWATVSGGSITGNNLVWRKVNFAAVTTSKIRVVVNSAVDGVARINEVEAWTAASGGATANIHWLVTDQLGTPRMVFDQSGNLANVSRHDYLPFGEELFAGTGGRTTAQGYSASDGVRQHFTDKERDNETGLDYFLARYYASAQGRFTSSDPVNTVIAQRAIDPQQINLYAYARNNPLKFVDSTGMKIDTSGLSKDDQKQWAEVVKLANAKDELGAYVNPELHAAYERLDQDERTFAIENHSFGDRSQVTGEFTITKFTADKKDFTEARIQLDFNKLKGLEKPVAADLVKGFNKFDGLIDAKHGGVLRLAELFGHEASHAIYALNNPAEGVKLQILLNDRDVAFDALPQKQRYPLPPDVQQKINAANKVLTPSERYAQENEERINRELNPKLRGANCKKN